MSTIAIDFDDTYTVDHKLWNRFIWDAQAIGHRVVMVTARRDTPENRAVIAEYLAESGVPSGAFPVYYTGLKAKRWYMETVWKVKVDIWIDDRPEVVVNGV